MTNSFLNEVGRGIAVGLIKLGSLGACANEQAAHVRNSGERSGSQSQLIRGIDRDTFIIE
jgi:hypothetical protein